jgi:hypothetical protein
MLMDTLPAPRLRFRWALRRLLKHASATGPKPLSAAPVEHAIYGFAQPLLGLRVLISDTELIREALEPALLLAGFCALVALVHPGEGSYWMARLETFYKVFAALAPLPSILFARHYARLAALARWRLGFGVCGPREYPLWVSIRRALEQLLLVYAGAFPVWLVVRAIPLLGRSLSWVVLALWGLHWVVVDAFDDARVLQPGETLRDAEAEDRRAPSPWFVRFFEHAADRIPLRPVSWFLRKFARRVDRLAMPWRGEIALMEGDRNVALGFSLSTSLLLATPVLNLLFRPIIIVASAHLLGQLEGEEPKGVAVVESREPANSSGDV